MKVFKPASAIFPDSGKYGSSRSGVIPEPTVIVRMKENEMEMLNERTCVALRYASAPNFDLGNPEATLVNERIEHVPDCL